MMMYEGSGLEEESIEDYEQEYEIANGRQQVNVPAYFPKSQTSSSNESTYSQERNPRMSQEQYKAGPSIHQVFEDPDIFDMPANGVTWQPSDHDYTVTNHVEALPESPSRAPAARPSPITSTSSSSLVSSSTSSDTNSVSVPTKKASLMVPGAIIPTLPMPMTRIPKKKKPQDVVPSDVMQLANVDITSEDGWNRVYTLLQQVEKANDTPQIVQLLKTYLKADTVLLTARLQENSNETAKLVRKLSKTNENDEVKMLATQCVSKWKKELKVKEDKSKKEKSAGEDKIKKSEKRRLSDESEKKKVKKTSKDDESPEAKKRKVEDVKKAPVKSGFMDALASAAEVPKKKPIPRKKPDPKPLVNDPLSLLDMIDEKRSKPVEPMSSFPAVTQRKSPSPPRVEDEIPVKQNRKIKFADEIGKKMVEIRYFEVEEGERMNVTRMTPEDMKHHEAMMERKFKQDTLRDVDEDEDKEVSWRCVPVVLSTDEQRYLESRGSKSEAKLEEEKRQASSLRAFCDPTQVFYITADPEGYDPRYVPPEPILIPVFTPEEVQKMKQPVIPTIPTSVPAPSSTADKPAGLPDNLRNLLDGLKKRGIVSGDGESSTSTMFGLNGLTAPQPVVPAYTQAPIPQPQYQQVPQQNFPQFQSQVNQFQQQQQPYAPLQQQQHFVHRPPPQQQQQRPGPSESWGRQPHRLCRQFQSGHCRYGDQCRFSHDLSTARPDNNRFRGGSDRGRYERRDFRDRRDYDRDRDHREDRSRDRESRHDGVSPPRSAQSPNVRSPILLSPKSTEPTVIPSERAE